MGSLLATRRVAAPDANVDLERQREDFRLQNDQFIMEKTVKMLLYGPGECGKTTVLRRMLLIHGHGKNLKRESLLYRGKICYNVIEGAALIIKALRKLYSRDVEPRFAAEADLILQAERHYTKVIESTKDATLEDPDPRLAGAIWRLYNESKVFRRCLKRKTEFSLFETWEHFAKKLKNYPEWGGPEWNPTLDDLLHSRIRTTGHNDLLFQMNGVHYELIDIGGQRNERKKFFFMFAEMDVLIFVASMADYDERLYEDLSENRLRETLRVWGKTVVSKDFNEPYILLFLNKFDLFKEKYAVQKKAIPRFKDTRPPPRLQDEEPGDKGYSKARTWFQQVFMDKVPAEHAQRVRPFVTSALDQSNNISEVMLLCIDFLKSKPILDGNLMY